MIRFPNCKINLGLWITERRPDGYHNLVSLFYPAPWCDVLEILPTDGKATTFSLSGDPVAGDSANNLCYRAWELMDSEYHIGPVQMHLHKVIPSGAGLGGGSADAAFTLCMLDELFQLGIGIRKLQGMALELGSDCPFFIRNTPALATGRGEKLEETGFRLDGYYLLMVKPDIHVSTAEAFSSVTPLPRSEKLSDLLALSDTEWKHVLTNDFEISVFNRHPQIREIREKMYRQGAVYASMSGSGSAVFGLFRENPGTADFGECRTYSTLLGR
jgi:4-diphosphocytidyl-2-C-methyl-D-erythritol kinase